MFQMENKSFLNKLSCKDVSLTGLWNFVSVKYYASTTRFYHRFFPNHYLTITVITFTTDPKLNLMLQYSLKRKLPLRNDYSINITQNLKVVEMVDLDIKEINITITNTTISNQLRFFSFSLCTVTLINIPLFLPQYSLDHH